MNSSEVSSTTSQCSGKSSSDEPFRTFSTSSLPSPHCSDSALVFHTKQSPSMSRLLPVNLPDLQSCQGVNTPSSGPALVPSTRSVTSPAGSPAKSPKTRRKAKKSNADSCIRRLCASHQNDIGLLCDLWSAPSPSQGLPHNPQKGTSMLAICSAPGLDATCGESERQRLLQVEMQLMRMQLQQAELLLPPSRSASSGPLGLSRAPSVEDPKMLANAGLDPSDCPHKPQLRLLLDDDHTYSVQIAQEQHQNLLWAEADYRASKRGSRPTTPAFSPLDQSDASVGQTSVSSDAPLCEGHLKMPRGRFRKFWCAKKRYCMLDSSRCFFYWKSEDQRDSGRAKCLSGVTGGTFLPGDDKAIELSYAGGSCVVLLRCESTADAKRWLVALNTLDAEASNERQLESESLGESGTSASNQNTLTSATKLSCSKTDLPRRIMTQADCTTRREVIQNVFLDEFRKEQQFEQMMRSSKSNPTTPCARENCTSSFVF